MKFKRVQGLIPQDHRPTHFLEKEEKPASKAEEKSLLKKYQLSWFEPARFFLIPLVFLLLAGFLIHSAIAINQDLGRHLKIGEIIWQTKQVPKTNLFSYTEPNFPFINHHWLGEMIFYRLYLASGIKGLITFNALVILAAFAIVFWLAYRRDYFLITILAAILSIGLIIERTDIRPEIFGFLGLAITLFILSKNKQKIAWHFWLLVPLQLLWANLHISFCFGLALIFFFFLDRLWARRRTIYLAARRRKIDGYILQVILAGILMGAACFLNPNTWRGALYPLAVFKNYGYSIVENQSPFFLETVLADPAILIFKISLAVLALSFLLNLKNFNLFYFLTSLTFVLLSWNAIRNFPLLGLVVLPVLVGNLTQTREGQARYFSSWERFRWRNALRLLTILAIFVILVGTIYNIVTDKFYLKWKKTERFGLSISADAARAVNFLKEQKISGRMFNNFDIGSYLIWRLYPEQKVFVDGRPEAYSEKFFQSIYILMQTDPSVWQYYADDVYKIDYIFFAHTDGTPWANTFLKTITQNKKWKMVYLDEAVAIWLRDLKENQFLIKKYGLDKDRLNEKMGQYLTSDNLNGLIRLGNFFEAAGFQDLAFLAFERAFRISPELKDLPMVLGRIKAGTGELNAAIEYFKKAIELDDKYLSAYLALGQIYYQIGDFSEARRNWQKVLEIEPENEQAKLYLDNMGLIPFKK